MIFPRILRHIVDRNNAHNCQIIEFEKRGLHSWVFVGTRDKNFCRCVCRAVLENFTSYATSEFAILGHVISSVDATVLIVSIVGGYIFLNEIYSTYIGSENQRKLIHSPNFFLRLLKRYMQQSSSALFVSIVTFSLTEFQSLKGAENRDWMISRTTLRKTVITGDLSIQDCPKWWPKKWVFDF